MKLRYLLLTGLYLLMSTAGLLLLKKGLAAQGAIFSGSGNLFSIFKNVMRNGMLLLGAVLYLLSFFAWLALMGHFRLTMIYPVVISLSILFITVGSALFLRETISINQGIGIGLLIAAINLILWK